MKASICSCPMNYALVIRNSKACFAKHRLVKNVKQRGKKGSAKRERNRGVSLTTFKRSLLSEQKREAETEREKPV